MGLMGGMKSQECFGMRNVITFACEGSERCLFLPQIGKLALLKQGLCFKLPNLYNEQVFMSWQLVTQSQKGRQQRYTSLRAKKKKRKKQVYRRELAISHSIHEISES